MAATQSTSDSPELNANKQVVRRKAFQRPKPVLTSRELPKPQRLSSNPTPLTNDPLWLQSFVNEGERGLTNAEGTKKFNADASGYVALVEREYDAIADCDKHVVKDIPQSAYAYYHHLMWWYRVAIMAKRRGEASPDQDRLIHFIEGYDVVLGAGAATYLAGMGDYADVRGVNHYLTAEEPGPDGHFGQITERTHRDYETKIAPAVSFNRILSDLEARGEDVEFRMPNGILPDLARPVRQPAAAAPAARPQAAPARGRGRGGRGRGRRNELALLLDREDEAPEGDALAGVQEPEEPEENEPEPPARHQPTANLLGWKTPKPFNKNQHFNMTKIIDDPDDVEFTNDRYRIHPRMFEFVFNRLREAKRYKLLGLPSSTIGSVAQQLAWVPEEPAYDRNVQYISCQGRVTSFANVPTRIVTAARVLCYNVIRNVHGEDEDRHPWSCLHWNRYREVPGDWSGNRNTYLVRGTQGLYEYTPFSTALEERDDAVTAFLNKFKARN